MGPASTWALPVGLLQAWLLAVTLSKSHLLPHDLKKLLQALVPRMPKGLPADL